MGTRGSVAAGARASCSSLRPLTPTHLLGGLLQPLQPVGQAVAVPTLGPGACCGLSQGLWAEEGV